MKRNILGKALSVFLVASMALSNSVTGYAAASGTEEAIEIEVSEVVEETSASEASSEASSEVSDEGKEEEEITVSNAGTEASSEESAEAASEASSDDALGLVIEDNTTGSSGEFNATEGECGPSLTWKLDSNGTLTISGNGDMTEYNGTSSYPWHSERKNIKKLIIGDEVTSITAYAFDTCTELSEVVWGKNVKVIGSHAFATTGISELVIPENVTTIGWNAFYNCGKLKKVTVNTKKLTNVGSSPFNNCVISEVKFAEGIDEIHDYLFHQATFNNCTITIPATVKRIGEYAFYAYGTKGISAVVFEEGSQLTEIAQYAFDCAPIETLALPSSVQIIGSHAFATTGISELVIPENVTTIGWNAFYNCGKLKKVTVNTKKLTNVGSSPFNNCAISEVKFAEGIDEIHDYLFHQATFNNCTITIPATVKRIGEYAFYAYGTKGISAVVFEEGSQLTEIAQYAFDCAPIETLTLPSSVQIIGSHAFATTGISELVIPENVTTIGWDAFYNCGKLKKVTVNTKKLTNVGSSPFNNCAISEVKFAEGIDEIHNYLFHQATFNNCTITIPATVKRIGEYAFYAYGTKGISAVVFEEGSQLTEIAQYAFDCAPIETLVLPSSVQIIGSHAFASTKISEVKIPEKVTEIGWDAFYNCGLLRKVTIPKSVTKIADGAFTTTSGMTIKMYVVKGTYAYEWVEKNASKYNYEIVSSSAINYELGGGTNNPANPTAYEKGESITLKDPTRIGYTFLGWFSDSKFANKVTKVDTSTGKDLTFHAKWEANEYTVTYDVNANDAVLSGNKSFTLKYDTVYPKTMSTATREGYKFDGWYTEAEGGTKIVPGTTKFNLSTPDNAKIYAHWTGITYKVRFNSNPATGKSKTTTQNFEYGKKAKLTKNSFTQKGVTFSGWNTEKDGSGTAFADEETVSNLAKVDKAVVDLYAQWKGTDYVVFFDAGSKDAVSGSLAKGERSYGALTDDEYEALGFKLSGVNTDNGFLQAMSYGDEFELSGDEFVRTGYVLTGWKNKNTGKAVKNGTLKNVTEKQEVVVLEAQWKLDNYKFSYNLNGGKYVAGASKGVAKYSVSTNTGIVYLPNCDAAGIKTKDLTLTKTGYVFEGWYDNAAFTGTQYTYVGITSDAEKAAGKEDVLKNTTFFAKWSPVTYFVTYNANGGKLEIAEADATVTLDYNENYQLDKESVSREGYTLEGWTLAADGTGKKLSANAKVKNLSTKDGETVTVYAKWKAVKNYKPSYKVTYSYSVQDNANVLASGTVVNKNSKLITSGKAYKLSKPTAKGYTFLGWKGEGAVTTDANGYVTGIKADNTATVSLVGVFKENTYNIKLSSNGGNYTVTGKTAKLDVKSGVKYTENVATDLAKLSDKFTKKGYALVGIALDAKGKNVLVYKDGSVNTLSPNAIGGEIARLSAKNNGTVTLNAVWEKVVAQKPVITGASAKNGKAHVTYSAGVTMADTTYEVQVSSSIIFKKSVTNTVTVSGKTADVALVGNKANYVRVRQIKTDSLGNKVTGQWSRRASVSK